MKKLTTKTKFQLGSAVILLLFCGMASIVAYLYLKNAATRNIYKETEILITIADSTRTYVKDVLRPKITEILPSDAFIPQAMSTSFVGREVLKRLSARFPDFRYKRAATDPTNPINQANTFEQEMIQWFNANPSSKEWHGVMQEGNRSYYTRFRAIVAEKECLYCHGDPSDAPKEMKAIYGDQGGFNYEVGKVVAADTIYIPIDVSFKMIKDTAGLVFVIAITSLFSLLALFYLLFNRTVVIELKGMVSKFQMISDQPYDNQVDQIESAGDEVEQLKTAFENVATDLKHAHESLKSSESKYRLLFETSQDTIMIFDAQMQLNEINQAGLKLFGFKDLNEAVSIETYYQLFWDPKDAQAWLAKIKQDGYVQDFEMRMVDRNGNKITAMVSATARVDDNGQFTGINAAFHDITERRRLERYMAQTEKLASIGQLASGVAHEINNPLEVIRLYANLIAANGEINDQAAQDLAVIQKHTDNCKHIVEALLNFARMSEPEKRDIDIHQCIDEVLAVTQIQLQDTDVQIVKEYGQSIPDVTADAQQLKQVFMNIIMNAKQAMPEKGRITIRTFLKEQDATLAIEIADTGPGIGESNLERIFDPFYTTKTNESGTGLGLAVTYGIVKRHGGNIEVESQIGKGTTFRVDLPLKAG